MRGKSESLRGTLLDEQCVFTLRELCIACDLHADRVVEMVEEGLLQPQGRSPTEWRFTGSAVIRARRALRLVQDLRVNWPGAALALDLLDEMEALRASALHARRLAAVRRRRSR